MSDWLLYSLVVLVGIVTGFINTLAGSGSLLTLPLIIFMGLPANVANGTNRIAIVLQSIVGVTGFKRKNVFKLSEGLWLTIPASIGAIIGAFVAVDLNEKMLNRIIGVLLIIMFFLILYKPEKWLKLNTDNVKSKPSIITSVVFFAIGFYGGFIQAGVGYFLLGGLVLGAGYDLLKANAIKVLIVLVYTIFALVVFIISKQVDYFLGTILGVGSMLGAWIATHVAVKNGTTFIRWIILITLLIFAIKLLFF